MLKVVRMELEFTTFMFKLNILRFFFLVVEVTCKQEYIADMWRLKEYKTTASYCSAYKSMVVGVHFVLLLTGTLHRLIKKVKK